MNKKEEIINCVFALFSEKGYMTSMSDIAEMVNIKVPSIYSHFSNKDEIIYTVVQKEINNYYEKLFALEKNVSDKITKEALENIYYFIFEYYNTKEKIRFWHNISLIQNNELRDTCKKMVTEKSIKNIANIKEIFNKGLMNKEIKCTSTDSITYLYLAMIQGILEGFLIYGEETTEYTKNIWEAFWEGIKP